MGNVTLTVHLDGDGSSPNPRGTPIVRAGTPLKGTVTVVVPFKIQGAEVVLLAYGKEKTFIKRGKAVFRSERSIYQSRSVLADYRERDIDKGQYNFRFSINIPDALPMSLNHMKASDNSCRVQYKVMAFIRNYKSLKRYFCVESVPLPDVTVPCFLEPTTELIMTMGRLNGCVTFGAAVKDTHIGRGQRIEVSVACKNNSTVNILNVSVKLVELCKWTASHGRYYEQTKKTLLLMENIDLPGLAKQKCSRSESRRPKPQVHRENCRPIHDALLSEENILTITIPKNARDSYQGSIVSVSHYLKIDLNTKAWTDNLSTKIPLRIGTPPVDHAAVPVDEAPSTQPARAPIAVSDEIPFVNAIPAPIMSDSSTTSQPSAAVPLSEAVVIGGTQVLDFGSEDQVAEMVDVVPLPPPVVPSFLSLLDEMWASVNDYDIISQKLRDPGWRMVFEALTPSEYGNVIAHVNMDFDQPRVAALLAPHMNHCNFTCEFCVAAVKNTADWNRAAMVEKLLPFCVDILRSHGEIQAELTEWEKTVTARHFESAVAKARQSRR